MIEQHTSSTLSIVLVVHDQADLLTQNLPSFLTLCSEYGHEMIVVDDASTDETPDVLKLMKESYACLYTTFLPASVRNPSRLRLAMTVGAKAAHNKRIVLATIDRPPLSATWLQGLAEGDVEAVLVYSGRKSKNTVLRHQYFDSLEEAAKFIIKAERNSGHGHQGRWLKYRRGMYEAVAVESHRVFDAIKLIDLPLSWHRLLGLRICVIWNNLFS